MCLYSKNRLPRIAWKPIKVYKLVYFKDSIYYTPYYHYKLKNKNLVNIVNTLLSVIFNIKKTRYRRYSDLYEVNNGFFHSFYDKSTALNRLSRIRDGLITDHILIEAIIPKFSLYYKGEFRDICSNRLNTEFKKI